MPKFIFITGGVVSSLGKGLAAAALGALLQARHVRVRLRKLDPYLNIDPGTMSPYQHGEVYVTDDGGETDLDLGHYERFTGVVCRKSDSITSGKVYSSVLAKERRGDYLGATVQVVPHIIDEIKSFITQDTEDADIIVCEIGGTVGDIESLPFLEAIRQLRNELGRENTLFLHVTLLPYIRAAGEMKTKPTQHSVKELLSVGIQPDLLLCRCDHFLTEEMKAKLSLFCNVSSQNVIEASDLERIYDAPIVYHQKGLDEAVCRYFHLSPPPPDLSVWQDISHRSRGQKGAVTIGIVGKYTQLPDAYKSLVEALIHGGMATEKTVHLRWIDATQVDQEETNTSLLEVLKEVDGIVVPGGFGERGVRGKLAAISHARQNHIPFLGICFGMQLAVIEACREILGLAEASSTELHPQALPVVGLMTEWVGKDLTHHRTQESDLGGTMRLGAYTCFLTPESKAAEIYQALSIEERHRHRYEVNMAFQESLARAGLYMVGFSPDGNLPEIVERRDHPWFIGVQFHPELKSRPFAPHPLFVSFIQHASQFSSKKVNS